MTTGKINQVVPKECTDVILGLTRQGIEGPYAYSIQGIVGTLYEPFDHRNILPHYHSQVLYILGSTSSGRNPQCFGTTKAQYTRYHVAQSIPPHYNSLYASIRTSHLFYAELNQSQEGGPFSTLRGIEPY